MLESSGMEYNLGKILFENGLEFFPVADISKLCFQSLFGKGFPQFIVYIEKVVLTAFQKYQALGPVPADLPAEFGADGTARSADQYCFTLQVSSNLLQINFNRLASQQVFQLDIANLTAAV